MRETTDRRIKYTQMVLKDSLVYLLKSKPITRITIKEICETADINRGTFYAHYTDQYDLLKKIEQDLISNINIHLDSCPVLDHHPHEQQMLTDIISYIGHNAELCRVLLGEHGDMDFVRDIKTVILQRLIAASHMTMPDDRSTTDYSFAFMIAGSIGMIQKWLDSGLDRPAAEVAGIIMQLSSQGLGAFARTD